MRRHSILVVEDEPNIQETLSAVLTLCGFKPICASNVEEAIAVLSRECVDAVSLDVRLPDPKGLERDGLSILRHLRSLAAYADVPVMVFTGADLQPDEAALIEEHHAKVFLKPQLYGDIIDELNRMLRPSPV